MTRFLVLLVLVAGCPTAPMVPAAYSAAEGECGTHCGCAVPDNQCSMPCSTCCTPQPCKKVDNPTGAE